MPPPYPLSIAPMLDRTDRHFRYFMRLLTRRTLLYTEMVSTGAIRHGDRERILGYSPEERPLVLQLGGSDPAELAECARIAADRGYDEVNLNAGCPSRRVQSGNFGASLMERPELAARCVAAMKAAVTIPVTIKHRLGVNERDSYDDLWRFVRALAAAGCDRFIVHARPALLVGLSPKANRTVPPLRYETVYRLKREHPELMIDINGGIRTLAEAEAHRRQVDGVMIGRAAYDNPYLFAQADACFFQDAKPPPPPREVVAAMMDYAGIWIGKGEPLARVAHPLLNLFAGRRGARAWRRHLSLATRHRDAGPELLLQALAEVPEEVSAAVPTTADSSLRSP